MNTPTAFSSSTARRALARRPRLVSMLFCGVVVVAAALLSGCETASPFEQELREASRVQVEARQSGFDGLDALRGWGALRAGLDAQAAEVVEIKVPKAFAKIGGKYQGPVPKGTTRMRVLAHPVFVHPVAESLDTAPFDRALLDQMSRHKDQRAWELVVANGTRDDAKVTALAILQGTPPAEAARLAQPPAGYELFSALVPLPPGEGEAGQEVAPRQQFFYAWALVDRETGRTVQKGLATLRHLSLNAGEMVAENFEGFPELLL